MGVYLCVYVFMRVCVCLEFFVGVEQFICNRVCLHVFARVFVSLRLIERLCACLFVLVC